MTTFIEAKQNKLYNRTIIGRKVIRVIDTELLRY